jgi:hypothetical protein
VLYVWLQYPKVRLYMRYLVPLLRYVIPWYCGILVPRCGGTLYRGPVVPLYRDVAVRCTTVLQYLVPRSCGTTYRSPAVPLYRNVAVLLYCDVPVRGTALLQYPLLQCACSATALRADMADQGLTDGEINGGIAR